MTLSKKISVSGMRRGAPGGLRNRPDESAKPGEGTQEEVLVA